MYNLAVLLTGIHATLTDLFNKLLLWYNPQAMTSVQGVFMQPSFVRLSVFITTYIT